MISRETLLENALMEIVVTEIDIYEGGSGDPVLIHSIACSIAEKALGLTHEELITIARAKKIKPSVFSTLTYG